MKKVFKSKVDAWLVCVILCCTIVPLSPLLYLDFSVIALCIVIATVALITIPLFCIRYIIEDKSLKIKCGHLFSQEFPLDDLLSIKATRTFLSAPAASIDRLELKFRNKSVIISPKDKIEFIDRIKESCPHEIEFCHSIRNVWSQ